MPWNSSIPTGSTLISASDELIQANFAAIEQGDVTSTRKVRLDSRDALSLSSDPTNATDVGYIYGKDVDSKIELHWIDEDGNVVQLTDGGAIKSQVLQVVTRNAFVTASDTGSSQISFDGDTPQNTEGTEVDTVTITPKSSTSTLVIQCNGMWFYDDSSSGSVTATFGLWQDSTANVLTAVPVFTGSNAATPDRGHVTIAHAMTSGTTSATTFKLRMGMNGALGTLYWGRSGAVATIYGSKALTTWSIYEVQ